MRQPRRNLISFAKVINTDFGKSLLLKASMIWSVADGTL